jgi:hypothetical protein
MRSTSRKLTGSEEEPVAIRADSDDEGPISLDQIPAEGEDVPDEEEDDKKMGLKTTYEGFGIWGWVLCLLVTRKAGPNKKKSENEAGQALMEEWISSTQEEEDEEG